MSATKNLCITYKQMPAYKTFEKFATKLAAALSFLQEDKPKRAITILKKLHESAVKRAAGKKTKKSGAKKPMNEYMQWAQQNRARISAENPGLSGKEIAKLLGKEYRKLKESGEVKISKAAASKKSATKKAATKKTTKKAATKKTSKKTTKKAAKPRAPKFF
jgi:hypothetical protein